MKVALVHDYLTQRGGAERVVLAMSDAFPDAAIYTSLYDPSGTFPDFADRDVRPLWLNRLAPLRARHRAAFPFLGPAFSSLELDADVVVCSSSGWAHGTRTSGRKIVYCHSPAKWLYRPDEYLGSRPKPLQRTVLRALRRPLRAWDARAARSADVYLANSTAIAAQIARAYGRDAEVLPPPVVLDVAGPRARPGELEPGFVLSIARPLPYKNVDRILEAAALLPDVRLVVVGGASDAHTPANATVLSDVSDGELRWLYANCTGLVAAALEDFGLTPVEAAAFGKPTAALRAGGFLDTVVAGETGTFFDTPEPAAIAAAIETLRAEAFDRHRLLDHAAHFSRDGFVARLREIVSVP